MAAGLLAGLVLAAGAPAPQSTPILPGYWEAHNTVSFPLPDEGVTHQCITPEKIAQVLSGPRNSHYQCQYVHAEIGDGKVTADGSCVDRSGLQANVQVDGVYAPETFRLTARMTVNLAGLPIPIRATTEAHRVASSCPIDDDR